MAENFSPTLRRLYQVLAHNVRSGLDWGQTRIMRVLKALPGFFRWWRSVLLLVLWISIEACIWGWERVERQARQRFGVQVHSLHRLIYCLVVSLTAGQAVLLFVTRARPNLWIALLCLAYGLAVQHFWRRSIRWCKQMLGVRPPRTFDPQDPYGGLDWGQ